MTQLRFTRSEWIRGLKAVTAEEAARRFGPINPIAWTIGHLAWQEQLYWLERAQGKTVLPEVKRFGYGKPLTVPSLEDAWVWWRAVTSAADPYLDSLAGATLTRRWNDGPCRPPALSCCRHRCAGGMTMAKGTLIAAMKIGQAAEDEFHDWYDTEHLPERQRLPGFLLCERWIGAEDPMVSVAAYDLETVAVLKTPAYLAIGGENLSPWSKRVTARVERLMRFEGDQILPGDELPPAKAGGLLLNAMNIAPEREAEFNEWYDKEHIPALRAVPGVLSARRFRGSGNRKYVALYHLAAPQVQELAEWKQARESDWTDRLKPHFRDHLRLVCRRYVRGG